MSRSVAGEVREELLLDAVGAREMSRGDLAKSGRDGVRLRCFPRFPLVVLFGEILWIIHHLVISCVYLLNTIHF